MADLDFLSVATPQLKLLTAHLKTRLTPENYESFVRHLGTLSEKYRKQLAAVPAGQERARVAYRLLEDEFKNSAHLAHNCSKGCGACCHLEVEITKDEGELLAQLVMDGHPIDHARLRKQAARPRQDPAWRERVTQDNRCVFLDATDSCGIYENRPGVCRKVLVTTPASFCSDATKNPELISIPLAELIISTALSQPNNPFASISKSVARGLDRFAELKAKSQEIPAVPSAEELAELLVPSDVATSDVGGEKLT
jgi:Fe-S-cluster containining protein